MINRLVTLSTVFLLSSCAHQEHDKLSQSYAEAPVVVNRIALGSCLRQRRRQPIWDAIIDTRPDLFVFLGDNIYANTMDMDVMRVKYEKLASQPGYQRLLSMSPVLATWDDHDYGGDDLGTEYPMKREAQRVFLEFFNVPRSSPRWGRDGVYDAQIFDSNNRTVQIILLDTRFFRSALRSEPLDEECRKRNYVSNDDPSATILGDEQWNWLEEQLRAPADLRIIASSIQVIPNQHCMEKWANFPHERSKLFGLIRDSDADGVILVSGDRHFADISRLKPSPVNYPIYELTTSSLNASRGDKFEPNQYRIGNRNFGSDNFGLIEVDWQQSDPQISLQIRDVNGDVVIAHRLSLSELRAK